MTERAIFEAAVEISDLAKRIAFLDEACEANAEMRERIDALLKSHDQAGSFLNIPAVGQNVKPDNGFDSRTTMMPAGSPPHDADEDGGKQDGPDLSFLLPSSKPGSIGLLGHYEVLQILGRGAFGLVFKAFDEKLHRMVAIKVLNPALAATSPPRKRFLREARSSAAVRHENIVAIHAVEEEPVPYLVMEYIPGKTLQQWLDEHGPLDSVDVLKFGQQIAVGLAAAHAQGLIHRDIKPANILIDTSIEARIKITDFGLARAVDDASMTQSGLIAGTPMYMAPEQARGQTLDHRADLFSLGTVLYTMASGRPPFRASNTIAVLKRVCEDAPRPVSEVIPGSPLWLDEIIAKLHAKEPDDRFQTAKEVADLLARYLIQPPSSSPHAPREESRTSPDANRANNSAPPTASPARSAHFTRSVKATIAVAIMAVVLMAAFLFLRARNSQTANLASRAASAPGHAEPTDSTNPDRRAAEYVLSIGGNIKIMDNRQERPIKAASDLPARTFELTFMDLFSNPKVSDVGLAAFQDCKNLTYLDLTNTRVSNAGLAYFKDCKKLSHLVLLSVTTVSDAGLAHFKDRNTFTTLQLSGTQVSDAGLAHFNDHKNLVYLGLAGTSVSAAGLAHFQDCKNLELLNLNSTQLSDAGLERLADYPKLTFLDIKKTKVTEAGVKRLSAALPGCKIEWDGGVIEPRTGWHGWPSDAPPPAIAPFDAEQAKQHQAAWAKYLGVPVEYTNSLGMKFRLIPPGEFLIGSTAAEIEEALNAEGDKTLHSYIKREGPQHKVILTKPNYLGIHEVTQSEYEKVMGQNPSHFAPMGAGKETVTGLKTTDHPVETVSWNDATEFCTKLSEREKLKPFKFELRAGETMTIAGTGYRLPTEAEWEYACRAGTATKYWFGNKDDDLVRAGWFGGNSGFRTHKVGELKANPLGLYDVHGNVAEWVQDGWDPTFYGQFQETHAIDPNSPFFAGSNRVFRDGHCSVPALFCRASSSRFDNAPSERNLASGFRVSLMVDAVRQTLKVDGPKIVKPGVPVGANGNPVAEQGRSAWDDLDPGQIPEAERVPRQPEGLVAVLGQHRRRVWNTIYSTAVSPDGTQFLLTTEDGLYLFGRDAKQPARFFNLGFRHSSATFLPDGRIAAFVTDGVVHKTQLLIFAKPRDGMPLKKQTTTNTNHNEQIHHATASSDGHWLAAFDQSEGICLWRLGDTPPQRLAKFVLPKLDLGILPCGFSPDAHWFCFTDSSQGQSAVHLIDLRGDTPREAAILKADADEKTDAPAKGFEQATFLSDGRLATADRNGRTWFWNINDGDPQRVGSIRATGLIAAAAQSLRLVTDIHKPGFRVWDLAVDPPQLLGSSGGSFVLDNVQTLAIAPDGETIFTGHINGAVRLWKVSQDGVTELDPLMPNPNVFYYGKTRVVDHLLCVSTESNAVAIRRPTGNGLQVGPDVSPAFWVLDVSPALRQMVVRESVHGGETRLLRADEDRMVETRRISGDNVLAATLNDVGNRLAIGRNNGADQVVELWGWESDDSPAKKLSEIKTSPAPVVQLVFAESGRALVGMVGPHIQIWDVKDDQFVPRTTLPPVAYGVLQFAVAPDGQTLATAGALGGLKLWNLKSDLTQPTASWAIPSTTAVAFSPDGRRLAVSFWENGASAGVQIIHLASRVVEKRLTFPGRIDELTFTDDSRHLITGNANATIYVVRLQNPPTK